jgi:UDP-glucose 4-epimerase
MARALVIGANGFIGSHVVEELVAQGHSVTAFDRFSAGVTRFDPGLDVRLVAGEFLNESDLSTAVEGQDIVLHFLSTSTPMSSQLDPALDVRTNVLQSIALLDICVRAGVGHVYFSSTGGAIYGPQSKTVFREDDIARPISPYGIGKLAIERYLEYFSATHGLKTTAFRISNPYGGRQRRTSRQGLIPIALRAAMGGEKIVRMGDGSMVRDYVYVKDVARMVAAFVDREVRHPIYNLGSGTGHSVNEIIDALSRVTGLSPSVIEVAKPPTFVDHVVLDISRFEAEFGGFQFTPLDEGIAATFEHLSQEAANERLIADTVQSALTQAPTRR